MTDQESKPKLEHWSFPGDDPSARLHLALIETLEGAFADIRLGGCPKETIEALTDEILEMVGSEPWSLLRTIHEGKLFLHGVASTSVNCGILGGLVYPHLALKSGSLSLFIRSVLLHDVGMLFLPSTILKKSGKLGERERAQLEAHPGIGNELLKEWGEPAEVYLTALHHHEEWKGTGYPQKLSQEAIHPFARLLGPILFLNALLSERHYRGSMVGYLAMKLMLNDNGKRFSPDVVKSLISIIGLYPPGSIALLTDGSVARVLETVKDNPLRPRVRVLIDSEGNVYRQESGIVLDLSKAPKLFLARPVSLHDIVKELG